MEMADLNLNGIFLLNDDAQKNKQGEGGVGAQWEGAEA